MASNPRAMFYKTAPYLYAKDFNLTSVLDGLTGYKIVSGETSAIQENEGGVFGEIKPREKPKLSENKYFTRQIVKKPLRYNPYERSSDKNNTKAYRPENYKASYGDEKEEGEGGVGEEGGSGDFFGLTEGQKSIQENAAFPGYQPYTEESNITATTLINHNVPSANDDELPSPDLDLLPGDPTPSYSRLHSRSRSSSSSASASRPVASLVGYDDDDDEGASASHDFGHDHEHEQEPDDLFAEQADEEEGDGDMDFYNQLESLAKGGKGMDYNSISKQENKKTQKTNTKKTTPGGTTAGQERLRLPETEQERWNHNSHKYAARTSSLASYKCWKCKRVGHLPEDCTAFLGVAAPTPGNPHRYDTGITDPNGQVYSKDLKRLYQKCKEIGARHGDKCGECGARANLAHCLDCGVVVCDNKSHLIRHLRNNPSHNMLYSYKLRRQIKCSKTTCNATNVRELFACAQCLEKAFDRHYSMMNAAWSGKGIKYIPNAICCDDHFEWHRINCVNARPGYSGMVVDSQMLDDPSLGGQLSEVLF